MRPHARKDVTIGRHRRPVDEKPRFPVYPLSGRERHPAGSPAIFSGVFNEKLHSHPAQFLHSKNAVY
jgi:hypothetical protein